jgi:hypothetical protein
MPPTASRDPAAWREPDVETAVRELAPGDAKKEEVDRRADVEVRKPADTRRESSGDVKVLPGIDAEVGLVFMVEMYFAGKC